jgi:hypothetical protein
MRLQHLIDELNVGTFNPVGLNILWPRNVAFLYVNPSFYCPMWKVELMLVCSLKLNTMSVFQLSFPQSLICMNSDCLLASAIYFVQMCPVKTEHDVMCHAERLRRADHMVRMSKVSSHLGL